MERRSSREVGMLDGYAFETVSKSSNVKWCPAGVEVGGGGVIAVSLRTMTSWSTMSSISMHVIDNLIRTARLSDFVGPS